MFKKALGSGKGCCKGWYAGRIVFSISEAIFIKKNLLNFLAIKAVSVTVRPSELMQKI